MNPNVFYSTVNATFEKNNCYMLDETQSGISRVPNWELKGELRKEMEQKLGHPSAQ